jgi:hypothetical protein
MALSQKWQVAGTDDRRERSGPPCTSQIVIAVNRSLCIRASDDAPKPFQIVLRLALQLSFCFEVRALSGRLVSSSPARPCDDMRGLNSLLSESDGDAADFLD